MTKTLSIIILSYNTKDYLLKCLDSITPFLQNDWEVIVVDNGSHDGSLTVAKKKFPFFTYIQNKKNLGFAAGNNVALRNIRSKYVMLLNSDTEFSKQSRISDLIFYMDTHKEVGVITPKLMLSKTRMDPACHRGIPNPWNALTYFSGLELFFKRVPVLTRIFGGYHQTWKNVSIIHEITACSAACMLVRSSAVKTVGLLDERYFFYGEDIDWCVRFLKQGWKIIFYPHVEVLHHKKKSGVGKKITIEQEKRIQRQAKSQFFDTMEIFYRKLYSNTYPTWVMRLVLFGIKVLKKMKGA